MSETQREAIRQAQRVTVLENAIASAIRILTPFKADKEHWAGILRDDLLKAHKGE